MRSSFISTALVLLSSGLGAYAHGFAISLTVDGTTYQGANGQSASGDSPFRKVSSGSPVTDPSSNDIICGLDAQTASKSASVNPGSELQVKWGAQTGGNWFHNVGPIITYMAACTGDCSSFSPDASTEWFKIEQQGESTPGDSSTWAQAKLLDGSPATFTIPKGLAAGNYLVRHEIISLQNSVSQGGTEYYPSCLQVTVGGNESGKPSTTVHFPGAYSETDPGILGNFYNPGTIYEFPGGIVAEIAGGGSGSGSGSGDSSSSAGSSTNTASSTAGNAAPSSTPAAPTGTASGIVNVAPTPSSTTSSTASTPSGTSTGSCKTKSSKKSKLRRRAAAASANNTSGEVPSRRSLKMHRKRLTAHGVSI